MLRSVSLVLISLGLAACGGGDDPPAGVDAPVNPGVDAPPSTVQEVTPCTGEAATIESTGGFRFDNGAGSSSVTINVGEIVKFVSGSSHNVIPVMPNSDPGLSVGFGATKCLRFTQAGTFNFRCQPHPSMTGSVVVN